MLSFLLYEGKGLPPGLQGVVNAGANIGSVIGQFSFGYLADALCVFFLLFLFSFQVYSMTSRMTSHFAFSLFPSRKHTFHNSPSPNLLQLKAQIQPCWCFHSGRKAVYGKELMIIIFATIMTISAPTGPFVRAGHPNNVLIWLSEHLSSIYFSASAIFLKYSLLSPCSPY